jgi:hypothetical protein
MMGSPHWSKDSEAALLSLYPETSNDVLGRMFGKTPKAIGLKARSMGAKKSASFMAEAVPRFKPGSTPFNKGKKGMNGESPTRFTAGRKPQTWQPVGTRVIDKDGNLVEKISDTSVRRNDWQPVHKLAWVAANGPVPTGHIVVFKPGRKTADPAQITADSVECITRAENMRRNTVHRLPKEIAQTLQLIGVLNRQIRKRTK